MRLIIGFSKAKSKLAIGSKVIQLVEKRNFSHVYMRYNHPLSKVELVTQASHGMVHQTSFELFKEANTVVEEYEFNIDTEKVKPFLEFIHKNLGKSYSRTQLVWIGIKKIVGVEVNIHNEDSSYICSELIARICEVINIVNTSDEDFITPSNLNEMIKSKINK